jgi:hypothetical protein
MVGLFIAILLTGLGASWLIYPQWGYRVVTPGQAARDHKRFKTLGLILFIIGLFLLVLRSFH